MHAVSEGMNDLVAHWIITNFVYIHCLNVFHLVAMTFQWWRLHTCFTLTHSTAAAQTKSAGLSNFVVSSL